MKFTITFEVDELPEGYGTFDETVKVIEEAIDHDLTNLEVWAKKLSIKVDK
jgi:hypothetical protein